MKLIVRIRPSGTKNKGVMVTVGKSVAKKASLRNLIKRRIRAVLTPVSRERGLSFLVIVKSSAVALNFPELKKELLDQIKK